MTPMKVDGPRPIETVRTTLADVPPSTHQARHTALSAALAEFDAIQAAGAGSGS